MEKQQWITYPIFVSSTFRDMDYERDAIKFTVIPRLNEHYRQQRLQFQAIDLRIGINTESLSEDEREDHVLNVCLDKIDQSRPFFIGLLGGRYGWVPDEERWHRVINRLSQQNRLLLGDSMGRSVTEMEILYGAIGRDGQYFNRSIFMIRSPESYEQMPEGLRAMYQDDYNPAFDSQQKQECNKYLSELKERIIAIARKKQLEQNVCRYNLTWDVHTGRFVDMKPFANLLFERLKSEIDKELQAIPSKLLTWQGQDQANAEATALLLSKDNIVTQAAKGALAALRKKPCQLLVTGPVGTGKSVVLAQCWQQLTKEGFEVCTAWVGHSTHQRQMRPILVRWIEQLAGKADGELAENVLIDHELTSEVMLYKRLRQQVEKAAAEGRKVAFVIDGIELLADYRKDDLFQMWIDKGMTVVLSAHNDTVESIGQYHSGMLNIELGNLEAKDKLRILEQLEHQGNIELPLTVSQQIARRQITPLELKLFMLLYSQLSITDFQLMRQQEGSDEMSKINQYLETLYIKAPTEFDHLVHYVIHTLVSRMQLPPSYEQFFQWIAASQCGLRESDIERLMGGEWDTLSFHSLTYLLGDLLMCDHFTQHWQIRSTAVRRALMPNDARQLYCKLAKSLLSLPDDDPLKRNILIFCLIESEDYEQGRGYLGTYKPYLNNDDIKEWLRVSTNLLLADPARLTHMKAIVAQMGSNEAVTLVYLLIEYGINDLSRRHETIKWSDELLGKVPIDHLNRRAAYQLAMLYMSAQSTDKHDDKEQRRPHLERALAALERCYKLDANNHNVRDMLCVALMDMIDFAIADGDLSRANSFIERASAL